MPRIMYGTAWKKLDTCRLVTLALNNGFKGIDTACQPKHYHEPGVGDALVNFNREEIFLQTKFTSISGQDANNCPYDKNLPLEEQIITSFEVKWYINFNSIQCLNLYDFSDFIKKFEDSLHRLACPSWSS